MRVHMAPVHADLEQACVCRKSRAIANHSLQAALRERTRGGVGAQAAMAALPGPAPRVLGWSRKHLSPWGREEVPENKLAAHPGECDEPHCLSPSEPSSLQASEHRGTFAATELNSSPEKSTRKGPKSFVVSAVQF